MSMKGRSWQSEKYRYGFNGKENDGDGGFQDYGMRVSKEKIGRFMSVDPITAQYPELTPYQFASNRPIDGIDLDGLEFSPFQMYQNQKKIEDARSKMTAGELKRSIELENKIHFWGAVITTGLFASPLIIPAAITLGYTAYTTPAVMNEVMASVWGMVLDEEYPLPASMDNQVKSVRTSFKHINSTRRASSSLSDDTFRENCQSCTDALFNYLKTGCATCAVPTKLLIDPKTNKVTSIDKIIKYYKEIKESKSVHKGVSRANVKEIMAKAGNGSLGMLSVTWKGLEDAHIFNVLNDGGTIRYIDAQTGEAFTDFSDVYISMQQARQGKGNMTLILNKSKMHESFDIKNP